MTRARRSLRYWSVDRRAGLGLAESAEGYFPIGEQLILHSLWPSTAAWLPAGVLDTLASGGSDTLSYARAIALALLYAVATYVATSAVFERRDVTD